MPDRADHRRQRPLSADARRLVVERIRSVGTLDILLLLRDQRERWWTVEEVAREVRCPTRWAMLELEQLHEGGLLAADGDSRYAFRPRSTRLAGAVDALADAYAAHTREVVALIFSAGP